MTHPSRGRRNWYGILIAVLCSAMAGLPLAVAGPVSVTGAGPAASGGDSGGPAARKPSATRIDPLDDFVTYLGSDDTPFVVLANSRAGSVWGMPARARAPAAFDIPVRFGLVRDGLTRGPPSA